jgi:hypothetical protein
MRIERSIVIGAPPERVWRLLAGWEEQATWMPDVAWVRVVSGEREIGARVEARAKLFGIPALLDRLTVVAWQSPSLMIADHTGFVRGRGVWRLEPFGSGSRFTWIESLRLPFGAPGELALLLYRPVQRWLLGRSMTNLKRLCESPGS